MYSCYDAYLVYGFMEKEGDQLLDGEWLEEHYPGMNSYASEIIRNYAGRYMIYGVICKINSETGVPIIGDGARESTNKLYQHYLKSNDLKAENVQLGYHMAISGDYKLEHDRYTLTD